MIVRIQAAGGSFRGAGKYYLHDKLKEGEEIALRDQGDERVWFTDTRNTLNIDPERALDEMWRTADSQAYLKMQADVRRGGRVCEDPVKTLSLSWHKDDRPTPEHMVQSADAFLKHMGWDQHQAVYVGHNDTEHRHIHIILNRVHPENGRTLDDYRDQKRAQVWALTYEKEHEQLRCEERELRAAKREGRAPEIDQHQKAADQSAEASRQAKPIALVAANDHLPHNVVMLARPHEQALAADDRQRAAATVHEADRLELKAEQRAEREDFFAEGRKLFKAARHASYDEVRKDYAPEWKQFYKDSEVAEKSAEAWSASAITRAAYFAKDGRFDEARAAFMDRDSVRDAVAGELADRKADLKERQTADVRARQDEVCLALRETREVDYQELLQQQRDERTAFKAGQSLEQIGHGVDRGANVGTAQNQNDARAATAVQPTQAASEPARETTQPAAEPTAGTALRIDPSAPAPEVATPDVAPTLEVPETTRQLSDLAAGAIGSVAGYLADQLGEMFAPTPPEIREAQGKAAAKAEEKREAEKPSLAETSNAYARQIAAAMRVVEEERTQETSAYWKDRDHGKGYERDQ